MHDHSSAAARVAGSVFDRAGWLLERSEGHCRAPVTSVSSSVAESVAETTTSTSTATSTPSAVAASIDEVLAAAGASCTADGKDQNCTMNGVNFTVTPGWESSAAMRGRACDEGFINTSYQVLRGGDWFIAADYDEDYPKLAAALEGQGVSAETVDYCP
ncbi:hypothetical protein SEA_CLOWN_55 [Gordonia phage Clown]|uniref:Uncharacterized protein n=1 Tax=Gordonia phage Clown TaxID=2759393 RepID=A0A7L7SHZ3_9CAUD|nr:hypothetical protein KNV25_gp55 [Gordonia phage Clown]QOC56053.1 hypothetical protein SEA_CLOWN_55 [Gordonia phage Clown]